MVGSEMIVRMGLMCMNGRNVIRLQMGNKLGFGGSNNKQMGSNKQMENSGEAEQDIDVNNVNLQADYCSNNAPFYSSGNASSLRLLNDKAEDKEKKVVAVIVTLCSNGSYDSLFTSVEQKSMEGTKVEVYACDSHYLQALVQAFQGKPKDDVAIRMMESINKVDPDCVVFNWECCGGYSNETFQ